ncbi:hypothetical protein QZH41_019338, partial [Actinostola sp. cb2023]
GNIACARQRIVIASLYLGTGHLEKQLVESIQNTIRNASKSGKKIEVDILLECTRGSRGKVNSRTMLLPLLQEFSNCVSVSLYLTPELRGIKKMILPERFNETVALTHLKVYLTDDTVIMSGANLSNDYFKNRQDRYIEIRDSPQVADFFHQLVSTVKTFSLQLSKDNTTSMHPSFSCHPTEDANGGKHFIKEASRRLFDFLEISKVNQAKLKLKSPQNEGKTWVVPLVQMFPYGVQQDEIVTSRLLASFPQESTLLLASGYFNLTSEYINLILKSKVHCDILTAHPSVNGFYKAAGLAGGIPHAYTHIAKAFFNLVKQHNQSDRITIQEYKRNKWTFHVKGLWYYPPHSPLPCLTLIGSPNFGYRSVFRDLEAQVAIVTEEKGLQQRLHDEQKQFYACAEKVADETFAIPDRRVPLWVKIVTPIIHKYF